MTCFVGHVFPQFPSLGHVNLATLLKKCADSSDFRDLQCVLATMKASKANSPKLSGFGTVSPNMWKAYYSQDPKKNCHLMCKPEDSNNFVTFNSQVIDGTKCSPETNDVCVSGFCIVIIILYIPFFKLEVIIINKTS